MHTNRVCVLRFTREQDTREHSAQFYRYLGRCLSLTTKLNVASTKYLYTRFRLIKMADFNLFTDTEIQILILNRK